jgi:hypothetical protein
VQPPPVQPPPVQPPPVQPPPVPPPPVQPPPVQPPPVQPPPVQPPPVQPPPVQPPPVQPPPVQPPPVRPPLVQPPPRTFAPSIINDVTFSSSGLYGKNFGLQSVCAGTGPLARVAGTTDENDPLAREWSRVRDNPNLSNCIGLVQRYSCDGF